MALNPNYRSGKKWENMNHNKENQLKQPRILTMQLLELVAKNIKRYYIPFVQKLVKILNK